MEQRPSRTKPITHTVFRLLVIALLTAIIAPIVGCVATMVYQCGIKSALANHRLNSLSLGERQEIIRFCHEETGKITEDMPFFTINEGATSMPSGRPLPPALLKLKFRRVSFSKESVSISLYFCVDSGTSLHIKNLDTSTPHAEVVSGEPPSSSPYATLKLAP